MALLASNGKGHLPDYEVQGARKVSFSPYSDNGGSVVALAGDDFCVIAADTRLSTGFSIYTRHQDKLFSLSKSTILGCCGCWCDTLTLTRLLSARMQMYKHEHQKEMTTPATAQMLSIMLYHKRFFPYYVSNILAGLDENGKGCIYSYDPIGHCERTTYRAAKDSSLTTSAIYSPDWMKMGKAVYTAMIQLVIVKELRIGQVVPLVHFCNHFSIIRLATRIRKASLPHP
ncbi:Proteasome subunit beta type-1 [Ooceraea biroi]|uniref:Proteasome subunit beta type-1 n=1 Tax=Ooceraea biroi TaxID=2015173 RepID=A0A026WJH3_OOCBI|nr:Proteasome subunit beta type-1 [Ooceraea biroi]